MGVSSLNTIFRNNFLFRFIGMSNEILKFSITDIFIFCLLTMCSSMLSLQFGFVEYQIEIWLIFFSFNKIAYTEIDCWFLLKMDQDSSRIELITLVFEAGWAFALMFGACDLGQTSVTNQFDLFNDKLLLCDVYLFPIDIQRMYVITLANAQQPIVISAYGNTPCTRETFKKVRNFLNFYFLKILSIIFWLIYFIYFRRCEQASHIL